MPKLRHLPNPVNTESKAVEIKLDDVLLYLRKLEHQIELQGQLLDAFVSAPAANAQRPMTIKELCKAHNFSRAHLHNLRKQGLPTLVISTGTIRFDPAAVDAWMKSRRPA